MIGGNRMFHSWKFIFLIVMSAVILTACGQSLEDRSAKGINLAEEVFLANNKVGTDEIDGVKLYKPLSFIIKDSSNAQNITFKKSDDTLILLINPNEKMDSHLFYDILLENENKKVVALETFIEDGTFGFAAVIESNDNNVELIASVGGSKITTLSKEKNIVTNLRVMMEVVRSINE